MSPSGVFASRVAQVSNGMIKNTSCQTGINKRARNDGIKCNRGIGDADERIELLGEVRESTHLGAKF